MSAKSRKSDEEREAGCRSGHPVDLSLVIPVLNEEPNVALLYAKLVDALRSTGSRNVEIIFVNDGSTDGTLRELTVLAESDPRVVVLDLRRNFGQTAAMSAGFDHSSGAVVVALDGDLQNDPADIPRLIAKLEEGFDVVSGWRIKRRDNLLLRTLPSRLANWLIGLVTGVRLHDYGCSLKAYRASIIKEVRLYGEMHRFIPALAHWVGARVTEIPVEHHPRKHGSTKYGLLRILTVLIDLTTVKFMLSFSTRPLQIFGLGGFVTFFVGSVILLVQLYRRLFWEGYNLADKPIVLAGVLMVILGVQLISMGLLAELQIRTYHESQGKPIYSIRRVIRRNLDRVPAGEPADYPD